MDTWPWHSHRAPCQKGLVLGLMPCWLRLEILIRIWRRGLAFLFWLLTNNVTGPASEDRSWVWSYWSLGPVWRKGGLSGGSSWLTAQEEGPGCIWLQPWIRVLGTSDIIQIRPSLSFQLKKWRPPECWQPAQGPQLISSVFSTFRLTNDLPWNISRCCCRTGFVFQVTDVPFIINAPSYCSTGHSSIYLVTLFTFSQSPLNQSLRKWADPCINECYQFSFPNYFQLLPACWWNIQENNLQTNAMALHWCRRFGTHLGCCVIYLLKWKDEDSLIDNVLFTSMSLGIRRCSFITDCKSHLQWQSSETPSAPIITLCSSHTNQNESWMQIKLSDPGCWNMWKWTMCTTGGEI